MKKKICFSAWLLLTSFCVLMFALLALPIAAPAATQDIGKVIAYTAGASVLRDGKTEPLALQAGILVSDTVQTDTAGRVKILFNDDSSVSLGPNTIMDMSEYADSGDKPTMGIHVGQGVVRAITGKITEQNPGGFKMTTPEATVGIRGTIISVRVEKGTTTVLVENTLRNVHVNNTNLPSGNKMVLSGGGMRMERITPDDRRSLGRDLAHQGRQGAAASAPEPGGGRLASADQLASPVGLTQPDAKLKETLAANKLGDTLNNTLGGNTLGSNTLGGSTLGSNTLGGSTLGGAPLPPTPINARVEGTLSSITSAIVLLPHLIGEFSFNVNLSSGSISNASMSFSDGPIPTLTPPYFSVSGGSGTFVNGVGAVINGFSGNGEITTGNPFTAGPSTKITLNPTSDVSSFSSNSVNGNYTVTNQSPYDSQMDAGTISGQRVP